MSRQALVTCLGSTLFVLYDCISCKWNSLRELKTNDNNNNRERCVFGFAVIVPDLYSILSIYSYQKF